MAAQVRADGAADHSSGRVVRGWTFPRGGDTGTSPGFQHVPGEKRAWFARDSTVHTTRFVQREGEDVRLAGDTHHPRIFPAAAHVNLTWYIFYLVGKKKGNEKRLEADKSGWCCCFVGT